MVAKKGGLLSRIINTAGGSDSDEDKSTPVDTVEENQLGCVDQLKIKSGVDAEKKTDPPPVVTLTEERKDEKLPPGTRTVGELTRIEPVDEIDRKVRRSYSIKESTANKLDTLARLADRPESRIVQKALDEYFERLESEVRLPKAK